MKAVRVHQPGGPEALKYEEVPTPTPGQSQALVKIEAAGVNFVDIYNRSVQYKNQLPFMVGGEASGVVESVGSGVTDIKKGDRLCTRACRVRMPNTLSHPSIASSGCPRGSIASLLRPCSCRE